MFVLLLILDLIPQFNNFYPSTTNSIILLFGAGFGFFLFFIARNIERNLGKRISPLIRFSGLMIAGFFLYEVYSWITVPKGYILYVELGIQLLFYTLIVIFVALGCSNLFDYTAMYYRGKEENMIKSIINFKTTIALIFSLIFSYFTFGRNIFSSVYPLPFHVDWLFISMITLVIGLGYYRYTSNKTSELDFPAKAGNSMIYNDKINRRIELQRAFIRKSEKDKLILYLLDKIVYQSKLMAEEEALDLLTPLIIYEEAPSKIYTFSISSEKSQKESEMKRKRVLRQVMNRIDKKISSEEIRIV